MQLSLNRLFTLTALPYQCMSQNTDIAP